MPETVALVSCGKTKLAHAAPAQELYTGQLFRAARAYVEAQGWQWYILSARHGLVHPETVLMPYDLTLVKMKHELRRAWAERVLKQIAREVPPGARIVMLAGIRYHEFLSPLRRSHVVEYPVVGLGLGKQIAWFKANSGGVA